jgi:Flp pilus assembly protein TadG
VALEVALVVPALLALLMLVVVTGRLADAQADLDAAASAAARAASREATGGAARQAALDAAAANLASATPCRDLDVATATERLVPGGSVTVTVSCAVDHSDIALVAVPGHRRLTSEATSVVDRYRGEGP